MSSPREEEAGRTERRNHASYYSVRLAKVCCLFGRNGQRPSSVPADIDCALSNYPTTRMNKDRAAHKFVMHLRRVEASGQKNMSSARQMSWLHRYRPSGRCHFWASVPMRDSWLCVPRLTMTRAVQTNKQWIDPRCPNRSPSIQIVVGPQPIGRYIDPTYNHGVADGQGSIEA